MIFLTVIIFCTITLPIKQGLEIFISKPCKFTLISFTQLAQFCACRNCVIKHNQVQFFFTIYSMDC